MLPIIYRPSYDEDALRELAEVLREVDSYFAQSGTPSDYMEEAERVADDYLKAAVNGPGTFNGAVCERIEEIDRLEKAIGIKAVGHAYTLRLLTACAEVVYGELGRLQEMPAYMLEERISGVYPLKSKKGTLLVLYNDKYDEDRLAEAALMGKKHVPMS